MPVSLRKLLEDYYYVEDLQLALSEVGESTTGTKAVLIDRLLRSWFAKNRTTKHLLEMLSEESLGDICSDFNINDNGAIDTLVRRIIKSGIIESKISESRASTMVNDNPSIQEPSVNVQKVTEHKHQETKQVNWLKSNLKYVISAAGVVATITTIILNLNNIANLIMNHK